MRTALDSNILSPILTTAPGSETLVEQLFKFRTEGALLISGPVFVELAAVPGVDFEQTQKVLEESFVNIDFELGEDVWRLAANKFSDYASRRRKSGGGQPKRMLADFLIAAHAIFKADRLMTRDAKRYATDFPNLLLI